MHRSLFVVVASLSLAGAMVITACGDDDAPGAAPGVDGGSSDGGPGRPSTSNPPVPKERIGAALAEAICDGLEPCCASGGYGFEAGACAAALGDGGLGALSPALGLLGDPTVVYDPAAAGDCVASFRGQLAQCSIPSDPDPNVTAARYAALLDAPALLRCARMVTGRKQLGEACQPGECAPLPGDEGFTLCAPSRLDDGGLAPPACRAQQFGGREGDPCDPDPSKPATNVARFCNSVTYRPESGAPPLACDPRTSRCVAQTAYYAALGASCAEQPCQPNGYCNDAKQCAPRAPVGASCVTDRCVAAAWCNAEQKCVAKAPDGTPCGGGTSVECLGRCNRKDVCAPGNDSFASDALCSGR